MVTLPGMLLCLGIQIDNTLKPKISSIW